MDLQARAGLGKSIFDLGANCPERLLQLGAIVKGLGQTSRVIHKQSNSSSVNHIKAYIIPSKRHQESNQKVPGRTGSWGPFSNLLVSLLVSLGGSYGSLNAVLRGTRDTLFMNYTDET
jgi:hypothetical protein